MSSFSFPKQEKLKHKRLFDLLFAKGKSKYIYPIRLIWLVVEEPLNESPILAGVTVPKRSFPKANQRNRLKRQLRESYRLNKDKLIPKIVCDGQLAILFIYSAKQFLPYAKIDSAIKNLTKHLLRVLSQ